jgi:hypothetical protein
MVPQPVTTPSPGYVALHAEIGAAVLDEHVVFLERALVEQHVEPLARRQLALGVLRVDPLLPAAEPGFRAALLQLFENFLHFLHDRHLRKARDRPKSQPVAARVEKASKRI